MTHQGYSVYKPPETRPGYNVTVYPFWTVTMRLIFHSVVAGEERVTAYALLSYPNMGKPQRPDDNWWKATKLYSASLLNLLPATNASPSSTPLPTIIV
jgi:hypothetical protein